MKIIIDTANIYEGLSDEKGNFKLGELIEFLDDHEYKWEREE